jgi:hypothetical protein
MFLVFTKWVAFDNIQNYKAKWDTAANVSGPKEGRPKP